MVNKRIFEITIFLLSLAVTSQPVAVLVVDKPYSETLTHHHPNPCISCSLCEGQVTI